jgi:hypothetical protein
MRILDLRATCSGLRATPGHPHAVRVGGPARVPTVFLEVSGIGNRFKLAIFFLV